ncbi:MAG: O-antigen ligase family protein [Acidimicrobiales bacterium]
MSEPVEVIELRPVGDATQPWRGSRLMGAAVAGLLLGVALVLVVKGDDLPVRTGLGRPGAGLFLVCVAAPFSSDSLDTVLRPSVDVAQLLILVTGSGMALGALALSTADVLAPVRRMPSAAYLALPARPPHRTEGDRCSRRTAERPRLPGGRHGRRCRDRSSWAGRATSPLIAALVVSLTLGVLIEAFGPRTELTQFFAADDGAFGYGRLRGGFADPNAAGRAAAALVVLCAGVAHRSTVWITGLGVAAAGLLVATQSRTAAIGGVVAIVVLIGARRDSRRFARRTSSAAAVVLFALFVVVAALAASPTARDLFERDDNPGELVTLTGRTQIWAASAGLGRQPLVGYGFGNSEDVLTEARRLGMIDNAVARAQRRLADHADLRCPQVGIVGVDRPVAPAPVVLTTPPAIDAGPGSARCRVLGHRVGLRLPNRLDRPHRLRVAGRARPNLTTGARLDGTLGRHACRHGEFS